MRPAPACFRITLVVVVAADSPITLTSAGIWPGLPIKELALADTKAVAEGVYAEGVSGKDRHLAWKR